MTFNGTSRPGAAAPTITVTGFDFGTSMPPGTPDIKTRCGTYAGGNGDVYGSRLQFVDDDNFQAGYNGPNGTNCMGIIVVSWSTSRVVLRFGDAYGTVDHWSVTNGDGYAISLNNGIFGGTVTGLGYR